MSTPVMQPWESYMEPFRIISNLYFVGNYHASSHMIDTGDGLVLIDTGYPQTLYLLIQSIWRLGFRPQDIKYILHSHGHYDHIGATRALAALTGAKTFIGSGDEDFAKGKLPLTWAEELGAVYYESFVPDVVLQDGDVVRLGNTEIHVISTPGHTPGTLSFFFPVEEEGKTYRVGMHGGAGIKSMEKQFLKKYNLDFLCRRQFFEGLKRLQNEHVDIFIGNHTWNNDTLGKYKRSLTEKKNPFIDPGEWQRFLETCRVNLENMIQSEGNDESL